jgi:arylformamidase
MNHQPKNHQHQAPKMMQVRHEIIDISPLISTQLAVWPGDTPLRRDVLCDIAKGANIDLSTIHATVHLGAHADAPRHYHAEGRTMEAVALNAYLGPCLVISVPRVPLILPDHCTPAIKQGAKRILFKTGSYPNPEVFNEDFTAFHPDAVGAMGEAGVVLIGIDTPSVDPFQSKDLPAHQQLFRHQMANLEGLVLDHVTDGNYELIALPLRLQGFDASPVRAVLRSLTKTGV